MESMSKLSLVLLALILMFTVCTGLQCYQCRGITHMDENGCVDPIYGKTTQQECRKGDECEKRIKRIDKHHAVIERGCSANCDGRDFIWNMDFHVHCCKNTNLCNAAPGQAIVTTPVVTLCTLLTAAFFLYMRL